MLAFSFLVLAAPVASAETRTLKLYYTHTREKAEITFKKNGRYIQSGLDKLNKFLRDWRRNEPTRMDPRLFDLVWETYRAVGGRDYIHVVSAYRSPATNSMLRKRSRGVAEKSQHMLGKAMDFYIPGVKLSKLRATAMKLQYGGVGYYPKSGSPFVHLDVGNVRAWPRMSRKELLALFPDGKTVHLPADGKPLPGYNQALAAYKTRKKNGGTIQMASASPGGGGFLSGLFGGGADDEEDSGEIAVAAAPELAATSFAPRANRSRSQAAVAPADENQVPAAEQPKAEPVPAVVEEPKTPETIIAALPAREVPRPLFAPRPQVDVGAEALVASTEALETETPAAADGGVQIAMGVPLPTWRPDYQPPAELTPDEAPVVLASAAAEDIVGSTAKRKDAGALAIADILDETTPPSGKGARLAALAPVPGTRPGWESQVSAYAALPQPRPELEDDLSPKMIALAAGHAKLSGKGSRIIAASSPATPRLAMLQRDPGTDIAAVLGTGVKTTEKSARPTARDAQRETKPVVQPVRERLAGWALREDFATQLRTAAEPARAYDAIRSAPSAVYTVGFLPEGQAIDPKRFTGSAVTFLSVAKFETN